MTTVLQFFPAALDVNGDAQNALVLAQRASWAGLDTHVLPIAIGDPVPAERPAAIVVGSSVDSELPALREAFAPFEGALRDWLADGVPLLAVGTGLELLSDGILLGEQLLEGVGIFAGRAQPTLVERATGDLVVDTAFGRLVGFENHARGFLVPADAPALGTVVHGVGNDRRSEGARAGSAFGTHLHGPVLAKNPRFADALLTAAFGDAYSAGDARIRFVDETARAAQDQILKRLEVNN